MSIKVNPNIGWLSLGAAALAAALSFVWLYPNQFTIWLAAAVALLFYAAVSGPHRREFAVFAVILIVSILLMRVVNDWVARATPNLLDTTFSNLDAGASLSFFHWTTRHPVIRLVLLTVYESLTFFVAICLVLSDRRSSFVRCFILAALAAPVFYLLLPGVGPAHLGDPYAPRNCMPSLHITWALLAVAFIAPRLRWIGLPFLLLLLFAVVGIGEHYVVDIAAAVPYAVGVLYAEELLCARFFRVRVPDRAVAPKPISIGS